MDSTKKTIFSGMQPTALPHIGNYLGSIRNWVNLQYDYNCLYCVVDMHSLTIRQDPIALRKRSMDLFTLYIAAGIDPEYSIVYFQSHVPAHAELSWILSCFTYVGELSRMTQFKDKSRNNAENINAGLYTYPVLMAADILLFKSDLVPIGNDQRQHLEICRDIAERFNSIYGDVFKIPEAYYGKLAARVMSLQEPEKKMSKSETENANNVVFLLDTPDVIMKKFKRAVTDSGNEVVRREDKPGISNLLEIYCASTGKTVDEAERDFEGKGYGYFKSAVGESVVDMIKPIQKKFSELSSDEEYLNNLAKVNSERAADLADRTLKNVQKNVGFTCI